MENNGIDNFRHFNSIEFTQISLRKINYVFIVGNVAKNSWWKSVKKVLLFAASLKRKFALVETIKSAIKLANTRQNVALSRATFFLFCRH